MRMRVTELTVKPYEYRYFAKYVGTAKLVDYVDNIDYMVSVGVWNDKIGKFSAPYLFSSFYYCVFDCNKNKSFFDDVDRDTYGC